jgi:hypothetical protein
MANRSFRPWGLLHWVFAHMDSHSWSLLGAIGTEARSLATWSSLQASRALNCHRLLCIDDSPSRFSTDCTKRLTERHSEYRSMGGDLACIEPHQLSEEYHRIVETCNGFLGKANDSVILDVTSLPKRFFFPLLRILLRSDPGTVKNLMVTYAVPDRYTKEHLAENFGDWTQVPLFAGKYTHKHAETLIVGVGFEALGLQERLETSESGRKIQFLLPFPAPAAAFQRSWELLWRLQQHQRHESLRVHRVDVKDVSDAFDRIVSLTDFGRKQSDLAPFGPKPMSVAMCIFATITDSEVFYTQPTVYHPDYSIGVAVREGRPEIYAYCLRLNGRDAFVIK